MTSVIKSDNLQMLSHPLDYLLNSKWSYYFHNIKDNNWKLDSYQHIYTFTNIEEFWRLFNIHPKYSFGFFFMMRDGISPIWEDESNINGGYWSFKIPKETSHEIWLKLCSYTIGEQICTNVTDSLQINGISISPKKVGEKLNEVINTFPSSWLIAPLNSSTFLPFFIRIKYPVGSLQQDTFPQSYEQP